MDKFELQKLRDLEIEGVAERLGITVRHRNFCCPAHADHNPSASISRTRNIWKCWVCGVGGNAIDLTMFALSKNFKEACIWLSNSKNIIIQQSNIQSSPFKGDREGLFDPSRYLRFFERPWLSPEAQKFLFEERKLDPRVIRWCRITSWRDRNGVNWLQTPYYDAEGRLIGVQNRRLKTDPLPSSPRGGENCYYQLREKQQEDNQLGDNLQSDNQPRDNQQEDNLQSDNQPRDNQQEDNHQRDNQKGDNLQRDNQLREQKDNAPNNAPPTHTVISLPREGRGGVVGAIEAVGVPRFKFPYGSHCSIYNLPIIKRLKEGDEVWIAEGCSDCWALLSSGRKAIAIPSATLLSAEDKELLVSLSSTLHLSWHQAPDQDLPGERLHLQLKQILPNLVRHQLPAGCKDISDYFVLTNNNMQL